MLKGNLSSFSLGEIFQSLAINNHTGTLKISSRTAGERCIYFSRGEISLFSTGSPEPLRLGEILIRRKRLKPEQLAAALEEQKRSPELLGTILVQKGFIEPEDIRVALDTKIREEIYDLFLLSEAEFEFHINHLPEEIFDPQQKNTRISINTSAVIMEGLRRVDEWRLIQRRIKTFDEIFILCRDQEAGADEADDGPAAVVLALLDGTKPVRVLFQQYSGSRFDCAKALYELVESGQARPLSVDEALDGGRGAAEARDHARAVDFLRFADQQDPKRSEILELLAISLHKLEREEEAHAALARALALHHQKGAHQRVLDLSRPLLEAPARLTLELAEMIFASALAVGEVDLARTAGNRLLSQAQEQQDYPRIAQVLEKFCELDPRDLNLRVELAAVCAKAGDHEGAVDHLERVAATLRPQKSKKCKELIKVLLLIFEIAPQQPGLKQEIQKLLAYQERLEQRKKQKVTIAGGCLIALVVLSGIPLFYELKARELYSHAQRLEEISMLSRDFSKVRAAYEQVLRSYSFSTLASKARLGIERVGTLEKLKLDSLNVERAVVEEAQQKKLQALRDALPGLLQEEKLAEEADDIQKAHEICTRIATGFSEVQGALNLPFPVKVTSSPPGAQVELNGTPAGLTPLVIHAQRSQELLLTLTRSGCESAQEKSRGGDRWRIHFELKRKPIGEMKLTGPIQQPLVLRGDRIAFLSRDGSLTVAHLERREVIWQRRVGRHGDLNSDLCSGEDGLYLGNVSGELTAVARDNGKALWKTRLSGAIIAAPALSEDGRFLAVGTVSGEVGIFESASGEIKGRFRAEDEIAGAPAFIGGSVLVGSSDHRLYRLSVPDGALQDTLELESGVVHSLCRRDDSVFFATADGKVHRVRADNGKLLWSCPAGGEIIGSPVVEGGLAVAATAAGNLVGIDLEKGTIAWTLKVAAGRPGRLAAAAGRIYAGAESGELTAVLAASGTREWSFKADVPILAAPLVAPRRLLVPCMSGKILIMELVE